MTIDAAKQQPGRFIQLESDEEHEAMKGLVRTDWSEVRSALDFGATLFFADGELDERDVHYLRHAYAQRKKKTNLRLRIRKTTHEGVKGRLLWLDPV